MNFEDQVSGLSANMLKNITNEVAEMGETGYDLITEVTTRALQHYSLLFLFLQENELTGDFVEWINTKRVDQAYRQESG